MQQRLPLAVLKPYPIRISLQENCELQQRLPLAVLKPSWICKSKWKRLVATALTACGIETPRSLRFLSLTVSVATALTACGIETAIVALLIQEIISCNSAYRLRY